MICTLIIIGVTLLITIIAGHKKSGPISTGSDGIGHSGVGGGGSTIYDNGTTITTAEGGNVRCDDWCAGEIGGVISFVIGTFIFAVLLAIYMNRKQQHKQQQKKQQQWLDGSNHLTSISISETEPPSTAHPDHEQEQEQEQQQQQPQHESQPQSPQSPQSPPSPQITTQLVQPEQGGPLDLSAFQPCSGHWIGSYHGSPYSLRNFGDHDMCVDLTFGADDHTMTGIKGRDDCGKFTLAGEYRIHTGRFACIKSYRFSTCTLAAHILYRGVFTNQRHITGTWERPDGDHGTFQLNYVETKVDQHLIEQVKHEEEEYHEKRFTISPSRSPAPPSAPAASENNAAPDST